jgi:hypothetical protein
MEQLLRGDPVDDPTAVRLARLLRAAAAPATRDELIHADTVCAAYAVNAPRLRHAATVRSGRPSAPMLALKVAAFVAAATAAGGVAFAASAGILPTPMNPHPTTTQGQASAKPALTRSSGPARPISTPGSAATSSPYPSASLSPSPAATPTPTGTTADIAALCAAYQAESPSKREDLLKTPEFAPLVAAARGSQNVKAYCAPKATTSRHAESNPTTQPTRPVIGAESTRSPTRQGG